MLELKGTNFSPYRWGPDAQKGQVTYTRSHSGRAQPRSQVPCLWVMFFHLKHYIYEDPQPPSTFMPHEFPRYFSKLILML